MLFIHLQLFIKDYYSIIHFVLVVIIIQHLHTLNLVPYTGESVVNKREAIYIYIYILVELTD